MCHVYKEYPSPLFLVSSGLRLTDKGTLSVKDCVAARMLTDFGLKFEEE